ncbi:hypothetical protein P389DRAFT_198597 [Cystobasidium minutum MCA 4210]|uniref:uncharacterized protein n=1 Tax=Cystobasidium minutum MCA 4210 TaxID=1397322 RepID=UPI0034CD0C19|eukprot:jgi/Rhomi1/198597/gm1.6811_g
MANMLKRLSATLAPNSSASSNSAASISPSHSQASSLDRLQSASTASTYQHHYASHHHQPSIHDIDTTAAAGMSTYPRPSGMSTPYSSSAPDLLSPELGYFGSLHPASSSSHTNRGGLSPSLQSTTTSRNVSPAQSPRLESRPFPGASVLSESNYAARPPPIPIDRPALQKSLRCLETLLVTMDEYRELSVRMSKVEKRLAKAGRELAGSINEEKGSSNGKARDKEPYSVLQALHVTSNLFESLSDVSTKFSRHLSKEYDLINDLIGKSFKKIAKEERTHDDLIESLDSKLKKANYTYDKKIRSSMPSSGLASGSGSMNSANTIQNVHEQFVPILSSLTDEIKQTKHRHGIKMFIKREEIVKETTKSLTCLSEIEFRKNCELVRRLGGYIGNVLALQALLGPSLGQTSTGGTGGNGEMPRNWPPELQDPDRLEGLSRNPDVQDGAYTEAGTDLQQGHVHPLAATGRPPREDLQERPEQQYNEIGRGRTLDDLVPPRAPFTLHPDNQSLTSHDRSRKGSDASANSSSAQRNLPPPPNRTYSNLSNGSSATSTSSRSVSLSQADHRSGSYDYNSEKYGSISAGSSLQTGDSGARGPVREQRSVSFPVEQMHRPPSAAMDHDATVTMRTAHAKPTVDTSFFPSVPAIAQRDVPSRRETGDSVYDTQKNTAREGGNEKEGSPTLKMQTGARTPALQPALSYSPSQSGRVGYFSERHARQIQEEEDEAALGGTRAQTQSKDGRHEADDQEASGNFRKMPSGFVVEETSPEQYTSNKRSIEQQQRLQSQSRSFGTRCSPGSASLGDSPTFTSGANTSNTSYSRNLNESYASPPTTRHSSATYSKEPADASAGEMGQQTGASLERSLSIESTASEKSFVARMKAKYAEEKEARRANQGPSSTSTPAHRAHTSSSATSADGRPSGRRVSSIAQKWEEKSMNGGSTSYVSSPSSNNASIAALGTGRPAHHHQHRASMPVVPSMASSRQWL